MPQERNPSQFVEVSAAAARAPDDVVVIGDALGFVDGAADINERATFDMSGVRGNAKVLAAEPWSQGQALYWNPAWGVFQVSPTGVPVGYAHEAKSAGVLHGKVANWRGIQTTNGQLTVTLDIANLPAGDDRKKIGTYVLHTFARPVRATGNLRINHSGLLPGTTTIELGDTVTPGSLFTAAAVSTLTAFSDLTVIAEPGIVLTDLLLTVGVGDFTDAVGKLVIIIDIAENGA